MPDVPPGAVYRMYVSAMTQLNLDRHNRVSTSDTRLIRRIVRDAAARGYIGRRNVAALGLGAARRKPVYLSLTENSDAIFNSSLAHELAVLRP